MRDVIQQFMWGFQGHFRWSLEDFAKTSLSSIGIEVAPEAYLVGFRATGEGAWPICVEPETGAYSPALLADAMAEADRLFAVHPERNMLISDPLLHSRAVRGRLESCRVKAIAAAFEASVPGRERSFFVGYPSVVDDYRVYPIVSVLRGRWGGYPHLDKEQHSSRIKTNFSLQHTLVTKVLDRATSLLGHPSTRDTLPDFDGSARQDTVRHSARAFVDNLVFVHGDWNGSSFPEAMDAVAAQPYEGRTGIGTLVLAKDGHPDVDVDIRFSEKIVLRKTRSFRKALEMSGPDLHLLSDGVHAYGLGRKALSYRETSESIYSVKVIGRGLWELAHESTPLLRVENGIARIPAERLSQARFLDTVDRIYGPMGDPQALWDLTLTAAKQQHGTMLVIHKDAASEAVRLAPQALAIEPRRLESDALSSLSSIDGAILVSPDAQCHAVGVILDGTAIPGTGDAARGARYNSAVRYHHATQPGTCMIVIVSEDGMINLLPYLARRVRRSEIVRAVQELEDSTLGEVDFERVGRLDRHMNALAFYLSSEQCGTVNRARERVEVARERSSSSFIKIGYQELMPDPTMDDSYFLPE
ncbi:diadenylate cyclase [Cryobacterium sp. W22_MBD10_FK3]|uniref:diadenylate cyclase n=1 Tax=Cryobacterium sp. W22_MBD10_FK3 TaxID=3240273 RepID=UPI003F911438